MHASLARLVAAVPAALLLAACGRTPAATGAPAATPAPRTISTVADVLERMRAAHGDSLPRAVSFVQANTVYLASGQVQQQWRVVVAPPGRMRMDYVPLTLRTGYLYLRDTVHAFQSGRRTATTSEVNPTLLAAFGLVAHPVATSSRLLEALGVKGSVVRRDTTAGRPAWVIGAAAGDLASDQLWVDAEHWVPLRVIDRETRGTRTTVTDLRFSDYQPAGGLPLARTITVHRDGRLAMRQVLRDVRVDPPVTDATFDPAQWVAGQPK